MADCARPSAGHGRLNSERVLSLQDHKQGGRVRGAGTRARLERDPDSAQGLQRGRSGLADFFEILIKVWICSSPCFFNL